MKKLLSVIATGVLLAAIAGCGGGNKKKITDIMPAVPSSTVYKSLNNIDQATAEALIKSFHDNIYKKQSLSKLNFWFDINVVKDIVTLLHDDAKSQAGAKYKVDGVRIYFASDVTNPSKISILLVTTTDSIYDPVLKTKLHHDYYAHLPENLFNETGVAGSVSLPGVPSSGAKLYAVSGNTSDDASCDFSTHPHYIKRADAEAMVRGFGNDVANTVSEWFETDFFEKLAAVPGCDGIRIYFATHTPTEAMDVRNRDAFIIATTGQDPQNGLPHSDFFDCRPIQKSAIKHEQSYFRSLPKEAPEDKGEMCPENCNTDTDGFRKKLPAVAPPKMNSKK